MDAQASEIRTPPGDPGARLRAEDFANRWLNSPLGPLASGPWLDRVVLALLCTWYFPLSRLWAAARAAEGSVERFYEEVPMSPIKGLGPRLRRTLAEFETAREAVNATEARWQQVFFGTEPMPPHKLVAVETARRDRRHAYNATRRHFNFLRRRGGVPMVRWDIDPPETVMAEYAQARHDPASMFAPPDPMPEVTVSRKVPGSVGLEHWLRFPSPSPRMADEVVARVYEPEGVADPPTLIYGHGVCVEFDHWHGMVDDVFKLCELGIRVIRPEAPWHGRRVPPGRYGGEAFIAIAPRGALDIFSAEIPEWAVLIDWARRTSGGPVAVGGSSLGALGAQLLATRCHDWPRRLQPDAMLLVTHCGQHEDAAIRGKLAQRWGVRAAAEANGWTPENTAEWLTLIDPIDAPVMKPENIVSVLGRYDTVTPYKSGKQLIERWGLPPENAFIWRRGHFSVPVTLQRDTAPLDRFYQIMRNLG